MSEAYNAEVRVRRGKRKRIIATIKAKESAKESGAEFRICPLSYLYKTSWIDQRTADAFLSGYLDLLHMRIFSLVS